MASTEPATMSPEELLCELIDCSRYGELEEVLQLLAVPNINVNARSEGGGNTALHMACANGHVEVVEALCKEGAEHFANAAGNYPLHWAIQGRHLACVQALFKAFPTADKMNVLAKNEFGQSAISEAFNAQNSDIVKLVLEHPSAEEDMRRQEAQAEAADDVDDASTDQSNGSKCAAAANKIAGEPEHSEVTHDLQLHAGVDTVLRIRELAIQRASSPFGTGADACQDTTGLGIWGSSLVMARWLTDAPMQKILKSATVVELGAGCGVAGLTAAVYTRAASVLMTDLNEATLDNLRHNVELNRSLFGGAHTPSVRPPSLSSASAPEGAVDDQSTAGAAMLGVAALSESETRGSATTSTSTERMAPSTAPAASSPAEASEPSELPEPPSTSGDGPTSPLPPTAAASDAASTPNAEGAASHQNGSAKVQETLPQLQAHHAATDSSTAAHTPPTPPALQCEVQVAALDWSDPSTYPPAGKAHVLLGCDLVYHKESVAPLIRVARKLVRPGGSLLLVSPASNRDGMKQLLEGVLGPKGGFKLVGAQVAPQEYLSNPLTEAVGSDVQFLLHFSDLVDGRYRLLHFRRQPSAHAAASSEPAAP